MYDIELVRLALTSIDLGEFALTSLAIGGALAMPYGIGMVVERVASIRYSNVKRGGLRFIRLGRLSLSYCITR